MNDIILCSAVEYRKLCVKAKNMQKRYNKAEALHLDVASKFYKAYMEISFRYEALNKTVQYIRKMSSEVVYPECVANASAFIIDILISHPECDGEDYSEYLEAALKLPDCRRRMNDFCNAMDAFTNYKVTSKELLFQQSVNMIARGIDLMLSVREHICPVERQKDNDR